MSEIKYPSPKLDSLKHFSLAFLKSQFSIKTACLRHFSVIIKSIGFSKNTRSEFFFLSYKLQTKQSWCKNSNHMGSIKSSKKWKSLFTSFPSTLSLSPKLPLSLLFICLCVHEQHSIPYWFFYWYRIWVFYLICLKKISLWLYTILCDKF